MNNNVTNREEIIRLLTQIEVALIQVRPVINIAIEDSDAAYGTDNVLSAHYKKLRDDTNEALKNVDKLITRDY